MSDDQSKAEELLQNSGNQQRSTSEPAVDESTPDLVDAIRQAHEDIDNGDASSNITVRDENLAALFHGLEETGLLDEVASDARNELGRDGTNTSRSQTLGDLSRIALRQIAPDTVEQAVNAKKEYLVSQESEF